MYVPSTVTATCSSSSTLRGAFVVRWLLSSHNPVDAKICHCRQCQVLHGAPFQWAVICDKSAVRFTSGVDELYFYNGESDRAQRILPCKLSCQRCRSPIADEGRRMFLAFGPLFDFGHPPQIPAAFQPTCHFFYGARVIDINDDKPKYLAQDAGLERERGNVFVFAVDPFQ